MEEDKFALVEKILKDVNIIMSKNSDLNEFDIVPVDFNYQNKTPVLHLENCLGLESWCIKHVFMFCYPKVMNKSLDKIKKRGLCADFNVEKFITLLNLTLLINPELNTLWNKRRELVKKRALNELAELKFTRLVLSRKPKCNEVFAYRRWILDTLMQDSELDVNSTEIILEEELYICELTANKSPNNYHSWNHHIWLIKKLKELQKIIDIDLIYLKEYNISEQLCSKHVSDFSCFHYRQFCISNIFTISNENWVKCKDLVNMDMKKKSLTLLIRNMPTDMKTSLEELLTFSPKEILSILFKDFENKCSCVSNSILICRKLEILLYELDLNSELLKFYKHHETLWIHRRFIIHELLKVMYNYFSVTRQNKIIVKSTCRKCNLNELREKHVKIVKYDGSHIYSCLMYNIILVNEQKFIEDRRNDGDNYADRHKHYLIHIEGFNKM